MFASSQDEDLVVSDAVVNNAGHNDTQLAFRAVAAAAKRFMGAVVERVVSEFRHWVALCAAFKVCISACWAHNLGDDSEER